MAKFAEPHPPHDKHAARSVQCSAVPCSDAAGSSSAASKGTRNKTAAVGIGGPARSLMSPSAGWPWRPVASGHSHTPHPHDPPIRQRAPRESSAGRPADRAQRQSPPAALAPSTSTRPYVPPFGAHLRDGKTAGCDHHPARLPACLPSPTPFRRPRRAAPRSARPPEHRVRPSSRARHTKRGAWGLDRARRPGLARAPARGRS